MKERDIARKVEPWIHVVPNGFAIASAIFLLAKSQYAPLPEKHICWIGAYSQGCIGDPDVECERGSAKTPIYGNFLAVIPFFIAYFLVFAIMMIIIHAIVQQNRKSDRWRMGGNQGKCCCYQHVNGTSLFKSSSAGQAGELIRRKRRFIWRKMTKTKSRKELAKSEQEKNVKAQNKLQRSSPSKCLRFSNEDMITQSEHRLIMVAASRSGNKEDPLSFDVNKVKKQIRSESHLARDVPIVLSNSKNTSIAKGNTSLRSKISSGRRTGTKHANTNPVSQCLLYISSFLVCFLFPSIARIYGFVGKEAPFVLLLLARMFTPLDGLLLILVYSRPEVKFLRSRNQDLSWFGALVITFKAGFDNGSSYYVDEGGIDVPRLPEAERKRRQEIVRQQYKRKSVTYKQLCSPNRDEQGLAIPQGCSLENDKEKEMKNDAVPAEKEGKSIFETKSTKSSSDVETRNANADAEKIARSSYEYEV
ncbi:predicted protein [Chaetoceros tenuissimus]|uniref:Uncharacterized protein n=1 Tax=Chaetoceros tenuissimus TaxID=426638 RepID=A0AAD3GZG0_9STRA|nr:predicted protein [Chaetoceros tenuissimus]